MCMYFAIQVIILDVKVLMLENLNYLIIFCESYDSSLIDEVVRLNVRHRQKYCAPQV